MTEKVRITLEVEYDVPRDVDQARARNIVRYQIADMVAHATATDDFGVTITKAVVVGHRGANWSAIVGSKQVKEC